MNNKFWMLLWCEAPNTSVFFFIFTQGARCTSQVKRIEACSVPFCTHPWLWSKIACFDPLIWSKQAHGWRSSDDTCEAHALCPQFRKAPHVALKEKSHIASEIFFFFFQCKEEEGDSLWICAAFNAPIVSYLSSRRLSDVPMCVYSCISCIECLFLGSVNLHNDESCRDLMTAVVDFFFMRLVITQLYQVTTTIKSISLISAQTRDRVINTWFNSEVC